MNFKHRVTVGNHTFSIKELSFIDYKNVCKTISFETDITAINTALDDLISTCVESTTTISLKEKVRLILEIRGLLLGNDIKITLGGINVTLNRSILIELFNKLIDDEEIVTSSDLTLTVGCINNFITSDESMIDVVCDCITNIVYHNHPISLVGFSLDEKKKIMYSLPGLPFLDIFNTIKSKYKQVDISTGTENTINISLFDGSLSYFLKVIIAESYSDLLDIEYLLRRKLSFNTYDLQNTPYMECQLMLTKLKNEANEKESSGGQNYSGA